MEDVDVIHNIRRKEDNMAEWISTIAQTIDANANILFDETVVPPCPKVRHRKFSGVFTFKGGRYLVTFGANVSLPAGETPAPVSLAITLNGEPLQGGTMTVTPAAAGDVFGIARTVEIDVPCNCCYTLSVKNIGTTPVTVEEANLISVKEA